MHSREVEALKKGPRRYGFATAKGMQRGPSRHNSRRSLCLTLAQALVPTKLFLRLVRAGWARSSVRTIMLQQQNSSTGMDFISLPNFREGGVPEATAKFAV